MASLFLLFAASRRLRGRDQITLFRSLQGRGRKNYQADSAGQTTASRALSSLSESQSRPYSAPIMDVPGQ
jgi:hypothetical protein